METREIFKAKLAYYIERSGKNYTQIAEEMNIPYTTFVDWANGKNFPRANGIERLSNYFGILKSDLLEEKNAMPKVPLSPHEKTVIEAYRSRPAMQPAVDRLLGVDED